MSLVLPAPVNTHEHADVLPAGPSPAGEEIDDSSLPESERLKKKLIYPPPEIRTLIDRTASALHRSLNPQSLESKIREGQKSDPKFSFLNSSDPYSTYYRYAQARLKEGVVDAAPPPGTAAGGEESALTGEQGQKEEVRPKDPRELEFVLQRPGMPAIDLDILKLTALFTARRGRAFLASLSQREGRNAQFDFLRPTHSLYPLYSRLVDQYSRVMTPPEELVAAVEVGKHRREGRELALVAAKERAEFEKWKRERDRKREDELEAREIAFAQIDWQDFVLVETIDFTSADQALALPGPTSVRELEARTLTEKRMSSLIMEEAAPAVEDESFAVELAPVVEETEQDVERRRKEEEAERAREIQRKYAESQGTMKIRKDYVPKSKQTQPQVPTIMHNGQAIPVDEIAEHLRIELLDPKWKENKEKLDHRRTQASLLQQGADVSASLRDLANARTDMFGSELDEDARKLQEDAERARRKEKERVIWDGHTASKETTLNKFQAGANFDEQIAAIHRAKGLAGLPEGAGPIGPGPAAFPQAPAASSSATISSLPQPPSSLPPIPQSSYASSPMPPSAPSAALPPGMHPSRMAALQDQPDLAAAYMTAPSYASPLPPYSAGQAAGSVSPLPPPPPGASATRPREEDAADEIGPPDAKRTKVDGQVFSEEEWMARNPYPITLSVQLPTVAGKPELDGSVLTLNAIGLNMTVGVLRERIQEATKTTLPLSKMRLDTAVGKVLNNKSSLASANLASGDTVSLNIRK